MTRLLMDTGPALRKTSSGMRPSSRSQDEALLSGHERDELSQHYFIRPGM